MKNNSLLAFFFAVFGTFNGYLSGQICQPPNAIPQPTFNAVRCYDASDTVNANPSANTHYTYAWSTGATTSSIIIALAQDSTFTVTVTNTQLNCSAVFTDTVRNDPEISNTNILTLICSDTASANLQLDGVGGNGVFTYSLTGRPANTSGYFPGLKSGNYTFNIVDGLGCSLYGGPTNINIPLSINETTFNITESPGCTQSKTVVVTPVNGGGFPFQYELLGGSFSSADSFTNLAPGTYSIVVQNIASGCTDTLSAVVSPGGDIASPTYKPVICYTVNNDTINANPNDSTNLTFSWNTGATTSYIISTGGSFSVTVTDTAADCSAVFSGDIHVDPQIYYSNIYDLSLCSVPPYANVTMQGRGGDSVFTYYLFGVDTNKTGYFPKLAPGNYAFAIFDSLGCEDTDMFDIPQGAKNATFNVEITPPTCSTLNNGEIVVSPTTPVQVGFYEYSLNGGSAQMDTAFTNVGIGNYNITIQNIATNCTYDTTAIVTAPQGDSASVTPDSINASPGTKDTMTVTTDFPTPGYTWYPTTGLSCTNCASPTVTIDSSMNGKYYYVKVYTTGDSACYALDSVLIRSQIPILFAMPNAFTPNGDGHDDYFGPASVMNSFASPTVKSFRIYNRYGQLVFSSTAANAAWDGKFKDKDQPVGTYVYYIEVQYTNIDTGQPVTQKQEGSVTLLR